jgi:type II secretory pathway pseudopilin PulG
MSVRSRLVQIFMKTLRQFDPDQLLPSREDTAAGEEGFMLLAVVVMVALLLIALSVAAPVVARQLQREKEVESQHRMNEYVRAIQLYQRRFSGQYPASIKILENTNNIRFLRHVYVDPLTGKADYKLIHLGEQKTKIHVFFGQELDGLAANLGSASGMQSGGGMAPGGMPGGGSTSVTSTNALNTGFGGATIGGSSSTSGFGTSTTGTSDTSGTSGTGGTGTSGTGSTSGTSSSSSSSDSSIGSLGVIVGVGTSKSGTSITEPNAQTSYEAWEFWYDPRIEMLKQGVNVTGGGMTGSGTTGSGMGSQSASSFGQSATSGVSNSTGSNGSNGSNSSFGSFGSTTGTSGSNGSNPSSNPNSSTPNPF